MKTIIISILLLPLIAFAADTYPAKGVMDIDGLSDEEIAKLFKESKKQLVAIQFSAFAKNWSCNARSEQFAQALKKGKGRNILALQVDAKKMKTVLCQEDLLFSRIHSNELVNSYIEKPKIPLEPIPEENESKKNWKLFWRE